MNYLIDVDNYDMSVWEEGFVPDHDHVVYVRANSKCVFGCGRSALKNKNTRVNPKKSIEEILRTKDSGKTAISHILEYLTDEPIALYYKEDGEPDETSRNQSDGEVELKKYFFGEKKDFLLYNNKGYTKKDFMEELVVPMVVEQFGENSLEDMLITNIAGDGDLWGRLGRHQKTKAALMNILNFFTRS
ncbi:MAG: hypothetical protein N0C84_00635 [Candidatus Thiodiazotropha taylori]|uniref:Uncharacterized protein n=1 Tax=Candidatus Thiodiazotropha taylori TaxID=2792791 RepID=A0A9E4K9D0_9GAMM|nr:hypothetical protein [Candidatus Thiodiazotropha taylori]MCW4254951.1 hypothetical protein [Candidatus Thiodiazotropha taylori]